MYQSERHIGLSPWRCAFTPSTTYRQLTEDEQKKVGVAPEAIRLSVGTEDIDEFPKTSIAHSRRRASGKQAAPTAKDCRTAKATFRRQARDYSALIVC